jgi:hypothetical protein
MLDVFISVVALAAGIFTMQVFGSSQPSANAQENAASGKHASPMTSRLWSGHV